MGVLEVVKKGFSITNKNTKLLLALFVFNLIVNTARVPFMPAAPATRPSAAAIVVSIILGFISIFIFAGVLGYLKEFIQTQKGELNSFVKNGTKFYLRILGIWVSVSLIFITFAVIVAFIVSIAVTVKNLAMIAISLAFALIAGGIGIYLFMLLFMSPYILVADDIGPVEAIRKSVSFARARILKIIGLFLLVALIVIGIGVVMGIITGITAFVLKGTAGQFIMMLVGSAFNTYVSILLPACILLYYMISSKAQNSV